MALVNSKDITNLATDVRRRLERVQGPGGDQNRARGLKESSERQAL